MPATRTDTVIVVPTYNESLNITSLLSLVLGLDDDYSVIVVDDNSPDGTGELVEEAQSNFPDRIHLVRRTGKGGLGTAYIEGFKLALEQGYQFVCQMDADFSHDPKDVPRLVAAVRDGADMAIGSRYYGGVRIINWPLSRLILSYGAGLYTRIITGIPIRDVTAGFKCIHRRVLEDIDLDRIRSNGYSFQVELHYRTWKKGFTIQEVPIVFTERVEGTSKMNKAIIREAAFKVWELRLRALFGRL
ncbi:MAG: polyprenol monophosphomannose synthase [Candidatus Latescibacterota bacterium]